MRKTILASAIFAVFATSALASDVIYVVRPPSVATNAKVLPQNAFGGGSTPSQPSNPGSGVNPDTVVFQSPYWSWDLNTDNANYVTFSHPDDALASASLASGNGYLHPVPSAAGGCFLLGSYDLSLITNRLGSVKNGAFVADINDQYKYEVMKLAPKKVGTYRLVVRCEGMDIAGATKAPWMTYGQYQRVTLRVTD